MYKTEKHPGYENHPVAVKDTQEFKDAKNNYLGLFVEANKDFIHPDPGQVGLQVKPEKTKDLPMPFACPSLVAAPTTGGGIVWMCDRGGCICTPAREDFKEKGESYPDYCPPWDWDERGGWEPDEEESDGGYDDE